MDGQWVVVMNHEEQYSIWPVDLDLPAGWMEQPKRGTKEECLAYIRETWVDMTPASLRCTHDASSPERADTDAPRSA